MNAKANTDHVEEQDLSLEEAAQIEQDIDEATRVTDDMAVEDADQVEPDLIGEPVDLAAETDESAEEPEAEEVAKAKSDGKRLSLKERLAARRQAEQGEETSDQEGRWYVLHTYSGYENKVKKTIETRVESLDLGERVYEVVVPTAGRDRDQERPAAYRPQARSSRAMCLSGWCWTMRPGTRCGIRRA